MAFLEISSLALFYPEINNLAQYKEKLNTFTLDRQEKNIPIFYEKMSLALVLSEKYLLASKLWETRFNTTVEPH